MQQKDLHKLGKTDLLTLIYKQEKQIQRLTKEVEDLNQQLENRTIQMKEAGSIAEASLKINKIFEAAQQAADEYLESIKEVNKPSQEYAQINKDITKDELNNKDKILSQDTYEEQTKHKIKKDKKQTKDKEISKELVLVNNEIVVIKPNFLKRVVILLMFIFEKMSKFKRICVENIKIKARSQKNKLKINFNKFYNKSKTKITTCIKHCTNKIKNIKLPKKKTNEQSKSETKPNADNSLMIINKRTILYYKILRISKKYLQKLQNCIVTGYEICIKYLKNKYRIFNIAKNKIHLYLKSFLESLKKKIVVLKSKISNKIHQVRKINKINEIIEKEKHKVSEFISKIVSNIKEKKKLKEVKQQTHEAVVKNMKISIPDIEEELKKRKDRKVKINFIKTLGYSAIVIIAFAIITSTSFFKILQVSGSSMEPNLHEGELLITSSFFKFGKGDIIAFYYNDSVLIKRVIATEGDVVNIEDDGTVFVNSVKLEENYVKELSYKNCDITFPYQVPKDSVFILGDNREISIDSRSKAIGSISKDKIIGKIKFKLNCTEPKKLDIF